MLFFSLVAASSVGNIQPSPKPTSHQPALHSVQRGQACMLRSLMGRNCKFVNIT